jgi:hypothetical protein
MPDARVILCHDSSEDAEHAIHRGRELRPGVRSCHRLAAHGGARPRLGDTGATVNFAELDGVRIGRACGLDAEPVAVNASDPSGTRSSQRPTPL